MKLPKSIRKILYRAIKWGSKSFGDPAASRWFSVEDSDTGMIVTEETAMQLSAVWAAVQLLSNSVAMLPLIVYQRIEGEGTSEKKRDPNHPIYQILHTKPNKTQTAFQFKKMMQAHLLLKGNAYAEIIPAGGKAVSELIVLQPDRVRPFWAPDGKKAYEYYPENGASRIILQDEMFHLPGLTLDGLKGLNPIEYHRRTLGIPMAAEKFAGRFFVNDGHPGVVLEHPQTLSPTARQNLREEWDEMHRGVTRSHRPAILQEGMKLAEGFTINLEDAQFLQTIKAGVTNIARIFNVPPHMIADLEKATYSNIEMQSLEFVIYNLGPWLVLWEQSASKDLFTEPDQKTHMAEFLVDALLRGNIKDRYAAYAVGRQWGWLSANDILAKENMNPFEGGDIKLVPLNMIPVQQLRSLWEEGGEDLMKGIVRSLITQKQNGQITPVEVEEEN